MSALDAEQLRKVLWTLYWHGTAQARERIEDALNPRAEPQRKAKDLPDPDEVLDEVTEFMSLARDGAYMYGDRRVSRTERTEWRGTFRNLATQAQSALHALDTGPAEQAMEQLIDLACEMRDVEYFHSEDPVEAARFVVSHAASALWRTVLDQHGFAVFAGRAAPQLIRWESRYGWTRGDGKVAEHETTARRGAGPTARIGGHVARVRGRLPVGAERGRPRRGRRGGQRLTQGAVGCPRAGVTPTTAAGTGRAPSRTGTRCWPSSWRAPMTPRWSTGWPATPPWPAPDVTFLRAQIADRSGDLGQARKLITGCLEELPGSQEFHEYAAEIGADLPPRARQASRRVVPRAADSLSAAHNQTHPV